MSNLHQGVQLRSAIPEVIAGTGVALEEVLAELIHIPVAQGAFAVGYTMILSDNVQGALVFPFGKR